jgi:hypothetical protein
VSWEDVEHSFDQTRPEDIVIHLDLVHFGELVGRVASEFAREAGLEQFDPHTPLAEHLVTDAWRYVCHMADRAEFVAQTQRDLAALDAPEPTSSAPVPTNPFGTRHLPEFGGVAPLPQDRAPDELNRRLEPPV